MTESAPHQERSWLFAGVAALLGLGAILWTAVGLGALIEGHRWPPAPSDGLVGIVLIAAHPNKPSLAWPPRVRPGLPGPGLVWPIAAVISATIGLALGAVLTLFGPTRRRGWASRIEIHRQLSAGAVQQRASHIRPSLAGRRSAPSEVAVPIGRDVVTGRALWGSIEDSYLVLGPPRSGKGVGVIIPGVVATPGAALVTATRPDTWAATVAIRNQERPVAVFDPQDLTRSEHQLRWSPTAGCHDPLVAILRARGLAAGAGFAAATTDAEFWTGSAAAVIRCYLHAAALGGLPISEVLSWVSRPVDPTPVAILQRHRDAAPGWAEELAAQAAADPRQRDGVWGGVRRAFDCLADPRVLTSCSPEAKDAFNASRFLTEGGTLYLLGSSGAQLSVAPLVAALIEDLVETARRTAAASKGGRLDPPLALWLDEAANIAPIPSLPSLLADGGGVGITTVAVLQSLAQARARWHEEAAGAMWDAATIKIVFGGLAHADDLMRISRLAGETDHTTTSWSGGPGGRSWSQGTRRLPVLAPEALRNLPAGRAVVFHRRTPPVEAALPPWWDQPIAAAVRASLDQVETSRDSEHNQEQSG